MSLIAINNRNTKILVLSLLLCILEIGANAQQTIPFAANTTDSLNRKQGEWTIFYNAQWVQVKNPKLASYYRSITYKDNKPLGIVKDFYISGKLQWTGTLLEDEPDEVYQGEVKWYNENGHISRKEFYAQGIKHGISKSYFEDGTLKSIEPYKKGQPHGKHISYNKKGEVYERTVYRNGLKKGKSVRYYFNRQIDILTRYENGEKEGKSTAYYSNGNVRTVGDYQAGKKTGMHSYYHKNGQLKHDIFYIDGEKNGTVREYYANGQLKSVSQYINGQQTDRELQYYESGQLKAEISNKNNEWDGPYISYYENGNINTIGYYTSFKKNGEFGFFRESGELKEQSNYKTGKKDGQQLIYYQNGAVWKKNLYEMGQQLSAEKYDQEGNLISSKDYQTKKSGFSGFGKESNTKLNSLMKKLKNAMDDGQFSEQKSILTDMIGIVSTDLVDSLPQMNESDRDAYFQKFGEVNMGDKLLASFHDMADLSEFEKEKRIKNFRLLINNFLEYSVRQSVNDPTAIVKMLEFRLVTKGIIFQSFESAKNQILANGDAAVIAQYNQWLKNNAQIAESTDDDTATDRLIVENRSLAKSLSENSYHFRQSITNQNVKWTELRDQLQADEAFIEIVRLKKYAKSNDVAYYFMVVKSTSETPELILLPEGELIEGNYLKAYRNRIQFKLADTASYNRYWKPAAKSLKGVKKVYLSPDGVFHQLNPESFINPATGNYLIDEFAIEIVSNGNSLLELKQKPDSFRKPVKEYAIDLFGYPEYNLKSNKKENKLDSLLNGNRTFINAKSEIVMLPGTMEEVQAIKSICQTIALKPSVYLKKSASEESVKKVSNPDILHIATHGFFLQNESDFNLAGYFDGSTEALINNPMLRSALLLSGATQGFKQQTTDGENGILTAQEVVNLSLEGTKLVVLSACETGLGEINYGEGVYGLQRAFMYAGTEAVLMSLWKIDDQASSELMQEFYKNLLINELPVNEALRKAKAALRAKYKEPYYWAAFRSIR